MNANFEYANATQEQLDEWAADAYHQQREADEWEAEQRQVRWAEAGGYRAGLSRPAY